MRNFLVLLIGVVLVSCSKNPVPKPDNLLDEEVMTDILFDISILQATEGAMPDKLTSEKINIETYIYEKYKIDSSTYYQNIRFYAGDAKKYQKMHLELMNRFDTLLKSKTNIPEKNKQNKVVPSFQ